MADSAELDALRRQATLASVAGFPFLLVFGLTWIGAAALTYVAPGDLAPWLYPVLGLPAAVVAIAVERRWGYVPAPRPDPLLPLVLQLNFVQIVAFPALLLVWDQEPAFMPAAFAAIVGAHFLPFQWLYGTRIYGALGVAVAVGPLLLVFGYRDDALHYTGFLVGATLLIGAFAARSHAARVLRQSG